MNRWDSMLRAWRYRWAQGVVVALLAALVTGCAVFAPWYDRALQQSMVRTALSNAAVDVSGLRIVTHTPESRDAQPLTTSQVVDSLPKSISRYFRPPVESSSVEAATRPVIPGSKVGALTWRSGMCEHLRFTAGSCPTTKNDIAISSKDAKLFKWHVGTALPITELTGSSTTTMVVRRTLNVAGIYRPIPGDGGYWFGSGPTGYAGAPHLIPGDRTSPGRGITHDVWLSPAATFAGKRAWRGYAGPGTGWGDTRNEVDLSMATSRVGIDQLLNLATRVPSYVVNQTNTMGSSWDAKPGTVLSTGVNDLASRARHDRDQANALVPLFLAQLTLLAAVTLWLVLGAAMEARRPEIALARLRGLSPRTARRMLLADIAPSIGLGAVLGVAMAAALTWVAEHTWLAGGTPFETRWPVPATVVAVVVGLTGVAWARARSTARVDPAKLLRRIPPRHRGWAVGVGDLLLIALAAAAFTASAAGFLSGPLGLAAPTLLALAVGTLLAHVLGPGAAVIGRWILRRGSIGGGLALLQTSRRPSTRKVIATITVATALLVFAGDAVLVGVRNRSARAQAETGAAVVNTINSSDVGAVQAAVRRADPTG